ncbi:hypothetical protein P7K49_012601 [Saguinus oedipus]|uniref:Uncharacterized protein n=1 Tax=Saguinus oedipus TaxID=9490 RepID=A0ABQ9VE45_SAGOE|nr:hypothetical protein P7K49_012601 [Saguinus oedipus]
MCENAPTAPAPCFVAALQGAGQPDGAVCAQERAENPGQVILQPSQSFESVPPSYKPVSVRLPKLTASYFALITYSIGEVTGRPSFPHLQCEVWLLHLSTAVFNDPACLGLTGPSPVICHLF